MNFVIKTLINLCCYKKTGVYPYEYMDSWEKIDEKFLTNKKGFYSSLNMEDITDVDYRHAKKYTNNLIIKI